MSELLKSLPSICGALQRCLVRAQSQTQAAFGLSGSISFGFHICQPQEKTEPRPVSLATCFADSASHFTTWYQADAGSRPLRPPTPFWRQDADHDAEPVRRDPDRREIRDGVAVALAESRLPRIGPSGQILVRGQVDLADDVGDLRHRRHHATASAEPRYGDLLTSSTGCAPSAARSCEVREHVRPVLRRRRATTASGSPRRRARSRRPAATSSRRVRDDRLLYSVCAAASMVEGSAGACRRADLGRHLQVEGVGRGAARPRRGRVVGAGVRREREQRPGLREDRQERRPAVVRPHGLLRRDPALSRRRRDRTRRGRPQQTRRDAATTTSRRTSSRPRPCVAKRAAHRRPPCELLTPVP